MAASSRLLLTWLGPQRAVSLSAPGLVIVVSPGQDLIEVNERTEVLSQTPSYSNGEIYVSRSLASHIASLARAAAQNQAALQSYGSSTPAIGGAAIYGSISLSAKSVPGVDAVIVNGTAPAGAPVLITLLAVVADDVPSIVVSRHNLAADGQGRFQAVIPTGPDYLAGSNIRVLATSVPTVKAASAQITVGAPNAGASTPTTHE